MKWYFVSIWNNMSVHPKDISFKLKKCLFLTEKMLLFKQKYVFFQLKRDVFSSKSWVLSIKKNFFLAKVMHYFLFISVIYVWTYMPHLHALESCGGTCHNFKFFHSVKNLYIFCDLLLCCLKIIYFMQINYFIGI